MMRNKGSIRTRRGAAGAAALALCLLAPLLLAPARAQDGKTSPDEVVKRTGIDQKLNAQVSPALVFKDETGKTVRIGDYFGKRPILLAPVYYECPMLCTLTLNGLVQAVRDLKFNTGEEYDIIAVSINPKETPPLADAKKRAYTASYGRPGKEKGWHFLTGEQAAIEELTQTVGFNYLYDEKTKQYAHAAGLMVLTPQGKVARYFFGIEFPPRFLRLALVDASESRVGSPVDKVLLFCYQYDPTTGKYSLVVMRLLQVAGVATFLVLGSFMLMMFLRDRQQQPPPGAPGSGAAGA